MSATVTFVLPSLMPTGGAQVVYRQAAALRSRGHRVTVVAVAPRLTTFRHWVFQRYFARVGEFLERYGVRAVAREVRRIDGTTVPTADVVIATSFETAEWVRDLPARTGRPAYFLQDYEAWTPDLEPRVDATWRLPFTRLAVSRWLVELGRERLGVPCWGPIGNGVDSERFRPPVARERALTIGAVYDARPGKGAEYLLAALTQIARERPAVRMLLFGRRRPRAPLPGPARFEVNPAWNRLPALYRTIDVFLHASVREGWGLPPMEAMASGCATVAVGSGGVPDFADSDSARLVPPADPEALARAAIHLIDSPAERAALATAGRRRMESFGWDGPCERFRAAVLAVAGEGADA